MKQIKIFIVFFLINSIFGFSQTSVDTIYIYFDSFHQTMEKGGGKIRKKNQDGSFTEKLIISYLIDEIVRPNPGMYDLGYTFVYHERTPFEMETFGGRASSKTLIKDLGFLKKINPLDHTFFETTEYVTVCKTFEEEDSHVQDVIIFMIDKDEIKDGKIILREVFFSRPAKE
jgi:hypothetical protein